MMHRTKIYNTWPGWGASLKENMEQMGKWLKLLRVTCESSAILDFVKNKTILHTNISEPAIIPTL